MDSLSAHGSHRDLLRIALVLALTVVVVAPTAVWASHQFADVPDDHTFHDDIGWIAEAGVTAGCLDGTVYCPQDPVTRGQMAAFLHRLSGNNPAVDPSVNAAMVGGLELFAAVTVAADGEIVGSVGPVDTVVKGGPGEYSIGFSEMHSSPAFPATVMPQITAMDTEVASGQACTWSLLGDATDVINTICRQVSDGSPSDSFHHVAVWRILPE